MGAITQVRVLGGIIGLSTVQAILLSSLHTSLAPLLTEEQLTSILSSTYNIAFLPPAAAAATRAAYGNAMNIQMRIVAGFAGASLLVGLFAWRKEAIDFDDVAKGRGPGQLRAIGETTAGTIAGTTAEDEERSHNGAQHNDIESEKALQTGNIGSGNEKPGVSESAPAQPETNEEMANIIS